jgi:hypothetical protein
VRYRVGASRGHYVRGAPAPTAIDTGTAFITNKRVIFEGSRQTRECNFTKLIGVQHDDAVGATTLSVSNRENISQAGKDLEQIDSERPAEPVGVPG